MAAKLSRTDLATREAAQEVKSPLKDFLPMWLQIREL